MMPIINGVGQSDITRIKQKHFREILRVHLQITGHIFKKNADKDWWNKRYYYFDLNAGRGHDCDGNIGSPLIFSEEAARAGIDAMAVFIEKEPENADVLRQCVSGVICGDHTEKLPELFPDNDKVWRYGLLYSDPNGVFDTECIRRFSEQPCFHATDILINCNSVEIFNIALETSKKSKTLIHAIMLSESVFSAKDVTLNLKNQAGKVYKDLSIKEINDLIQKKDYLNVFK